MKAIFKKILKPIYIKYKEVKGFFFPTLRSKELYKKRIGRKCNLKNPKSLTEKLMYYKLNLYWKNDIVTKLVDKYKVRDYVNNAGLGSILNTLYGVWDNAKDIDWEKLPNQFVLKINNGSGFNIIVKDKSSLNIRDTIKTLNKWLRINYGTLYGERGIYIKVDRKIIAEKYIEEYEKESVDDYKFFCSYGEVKFLFVACDRNETTKFDFYTPEWKWIDVKNVFANKGPVEKPKNYELMLRYASILSKKFPLIRIDFYDVNGQIYFGECTFTHFGCIAPFTPDEYDFKFGSLFPDVHAANNIRE